MRGALLIAWREYRQYVFSRGFLLLLLVVPVGLVVVGSLFQVASNTVPVRPFMVIETGDRYTTQIDAYLNREASRATVTAWLQYARFGAGASYGGKIDPAFDPDTDFATLDARVDAFVAAGGVAAANAALAPYRAEGAPNFVAPRRRFQRVATPRDVRDASAPDFVSRLRAYMAGATGATGAVTGGGDEPLFAALVLPAGFGTGGAPGAADAPTVRAQYWSTNLVDAELRSLLQRALTRALQREAALDAGLSDSGFSAVVNARAGIDDFRPDRAVGEAALDLGDRVKSGLPAIMTYVLFILIFSVGSLLLTNTIEERSNKIVESLLSSVTAGELMVGKLVGIGAVGLTIPAIGTLIATLAAFTVMADNAILREIVLALVFSPLVWVYLFYFICGYVIFAMIYLAIGAISNSLQDAQTFIGPVTLVVMAPFPLMAFVFQDPNGLIAKIMTWIPIYTPYAVMLRAAADPPLWEIIGATIVMLIFAVFFVRIMGRIFRRGLLNDSPPNLRSLIHLAGREKP
ncbi:MAG: ABC transporter permease [Pseudomonadota bacterium]